MGSQGPQLWAILAGVIVNASLLLLAIGKITGELKRIWKDFPPHRHVNGKILYPADYVPTDVERLGEVQ